MKFRRCLRIYSRELSRAMKNCNIPSESNFRPYSYNRDTALFLFAPDFNVFSRKNTKGEQALLCFSGRVTRATLLEFPSSISSRGINLSSRLILFLSILIGFPSGQYSDFPEIRRSFQVRHQKRHAQVRRLLSYGNSPPNCNQDINQESFKHLVFPFDP